MSQILMPFVIDASIVLAWAFAEEQAVADIARELLRRDVALAPRLWWYEIRNGLVIAERRGRSNETYSAAFLRELSRLPIAADYDPDEHQALGLARRHRLTMYDAVYLDLAVRQAAPLAT